MQKAINNIKEALRGYYPDSEIAVFTRMILGYATGRPYSSALIDDAEIAEGMQVKIDSITERLQKYEPIQYILGETEFFGLPVKVTRDTLIPRPETEELVELIINECTQKDPHILDIGTGTGCIAIALARHMRQARVSAWDFSIRALDVAVRNCKANAVQVDLENVDVLAEYPRDKQYDIIVSNPPYVLESERADMDGNVLLYEPHCALFVPDNKALMFYERIADIALDILKPFGALYFEINSRKGIETLEMLEKKGFTDIELFKDISRNDRMVRARKDI